MHPELRGFIEDLVVLLHEKYNQSLDDYMSRTAGTGDGGFSRGANMAYYDTLDLIRSQLLAYGYELDDLDTIVPELGKPARR